MSDSIQDARFKKLLEIADEWGSEFSEEGKEAFELAAFIIAEMSRGKVYGHFC